MADGGVKSLCLAKISSATTMPILPRYSMKNLQSTKDCFEEREVSLGWSLCVHPA
jgi:hypothetical protein